jgi:hypothetical protein
VENGNLLGLNQPTQLDEHDAWVAVVSSLSHLNLTPFEAKALYVFGLMRQLAEGSISHQGSRDLVAFVLLADAAEAFGRCLTGCQKENSGSGDRLRYGLKQLERRDDDGEFRTMFGLYTVDDIKAMRNFTTHGGTTPGKNGILDAHLSALLLNRFGDELTDYWVRLSQDGNAERTMLAEARIRPLFTGGKPVFIEDMFDMMTKPGARAGQGIQVQLR